MALTRTDRGLHVSASSHGTGSFSTGSFTPTANSLLVVVVHQMWDNNSGTLNQPTISGGSLTYTARGFANLTDSFATRTTVFTAPVGGSPSSMTITVDDADNRNMFGWQVGVIEYVGANNTSPVAGFVGSGTTDILDNAESQTLGEAPALVDESIIALGIDASTTGSNPSWQTGWTEIHNGGTSGGGGNIGTAYRTNSTSTTADILDPHTAGGSFFKASMVSFIVKNGSFPTDTGVRHSNDTGQFGGPVISSHGNVYVFGLDVDAGTSHTITAARATDPASAWSDVATWQPGSTAETVRGLDAFQDGDSVYVAAYKDAATPVVYYNVFTMTSGGGSWGTEQSFSVAHGTNEEPGALAVVIGKRDSDGDVIVAYHGGAFRDMGKNYERVFYNKWNGTGWDGETQIDGAGSLESGAALGENLVIDSSDRTHFLFEVGNGFNYHRSLTSADTLNSRGSFDSTSIPTWGNNTLPEQHIGRAVIYDDAGTEEITVGYAKTTTAKGAWAKWDAGDLAQTNKTTGTFDDSGNNPRQVLYGAWNEKMFSSMANENDTNIYVAWIQGTLQDIFHDTRTVAGATWGTDVDFNNVTALASWASIFARGGFYRLAICYRESANVQYGEVQLSASTTPALPPLVMPPPIPA